MYSHYGDKENLFLTVVRDTYDLMRGHFAAIIDRALTDAADAEKSLVSGIREAAAEVSRSPERALLLRLMIAELPRFPALLEIWRSRAIIPVLAQAVTRLTAAGLPSAGDPEQAADHLSALTFGQINSRSMMGTIPLSDTETETETETDQIITSGIRVFLCAYGVSPSARPPGC